LLLNERDHVTETAAANFLLVRSGTVYAPKPSEVLGGISLQVLRGLCALHEISFRERSLTLDDCLAADEALLTSTPYCLAGVRRLNDTTYPSPGPLTRRLHAAWSEVIGLDIWAQFQQAAT
jgi:branched-subunit amino acid aminotransferase/4-amino-4-deoxychorismate lyase